MIDIGNFEDPRGGPNKTCSIFVTKNIIGGVMSMYFHRIHINTHGMLASSTTENTKFDNDV